MTASLTDQQQGTQKDPGLEAFRVIHMFLLLPLWGECSDGERQAKDWVQDQQPRRPERDGRVFRASLLH